MLFARVAKPIEQSHVKKSLQLLMLADGLLIGLSCADLKQLQKGILKKEEAQFIDSRYYAANLIARRKIIWHE